MNISYENTATKLRPKDFNALTGQEFVVSTICNSLKNNEIAPAYLFSGPRGVGKTSAARLFALAINRPENTDIDTLFYEGSDDIRLGKALDVIEIDGASYTSVENVRKIQEEIQYNPVHFRYKVYIIDEVHMLSNSAFNALLKTIEEPPAQVVFIFATTELHKVPATIRSRCQQFTFRLISIKDIVTKLMAICDADGIQYEQNALRWIAKEAQGSLRDAYMLFDQIKAFSNGAIQLEIIKQFMGFAGVDVLNDILESCVNSDREEVLQQLHEVWNQGVSIEQIVLETAEYLRNVLLLKARIDAEELIGYPKEFFRASIYETLTTDQLEFALSLVLECYRNLRYSANTRFEVEVVFSHLCEIREYVTPRQLINQLKTLKEAHSPAERDMPRFTAKQQQTYETNSATPTSVPMQSGQTEDTPVDRATPETSSAGGHTRPYRASEVDRTTPETSSAREYSEGGGEQREPVSPTEAPLAKEQVESNAPAEDSVQSTHASSQSLWNKVVSSVQEKNDPFSLILDAAEVELQDTVLNIVFHDEYSYSKYLHFEKNLLALVRKLSNQDIMMYASLSEKHASMKNSRKNIPLADEQDVPLQNGQSRESVRPQTSEKNATTDTITRSKGELDLRQRIDNTEQDEPQETEENQDVKNIIQVFGGEVKK